MSNQAEHSTLISDDQQISVCNEPDKRLVIDAGGKIGMEEGLVDVKRFNDTHPQVRNGHLIGKNILLEMLSQENCAGINFYNAIDAKGHVGLVYVGVDATGHELDVVIKANGDRVAGIVANRSWNPYGDNDGYWWYDY